jgi:DNA-binding SARP family transcriptional activator
MTAGRGGRARLRLLGDFGLTSGEEPLRVSRPAERVLAYVAVVHGHRPVRRTTLAERMWPDATPARAAQSLRSVLWRLPRPRGRALLTGRETSVQLLGDLQVDLWEADDLVAALRDESPGPAGEADLRTLHEDLLPDWHEEWLEVERESWRQKRLHALERCAGALCDRGDYTDALAAGLGAVRSEPLRESAHRRVIAVHLAEGNHAEALRQYDGYRRLLAAELGLPPSPEIRTMLAPLLGRPIDRPARPDRAAGRRGAADRRTP